MAPAAKLTEYELARLKRMQNNAKYMEEIGVLESKRELEAAVAKPKVHRAPTKPRQPQDRAPKRASSRVASLPERPSYREMEGESLSRRGRGGGGGGSNRSFPRGNAPTKAMEEAADAAMDLAANLQAPCLLKTVVPSQMSGGFWMGLNANFCKDHMPQQETTVVLEDPDGKEWESIYKAEKGALSGGWRGFALDHRLDAGDALLFELAEPTRLRVHIFRAIEMPAAVKAGLTPGENSVPLRPEEYVYERSVYTVRARKPIEEEEGGTKKRKSPKPEEGEAKPKKKQKKAKEVEAAARDEESEDDVVELKPEEAKKVTKRAGGKVRAGREKQGGITQRRASSRGETAPQQIQKGKGGKPTGPSEEEPGGKKGKKTISLNAVQSTSTPLRRTRAKAGGIYIVEFITEKRKNGKEVEWKAKLEGLDEEIWVASTSFLDNKKKCKLA